MMTCEELCSSPLLEAIAENFSSMEAATALIARVGLRITQLPPFGQPSIEQWWRQACHQAERSLGRQGLLALLENAADDNPGDPRFADFVAEDSEPEKRRSDAEIDISVSDSVMNSGLVTMNDLSELLRNLVGVARAAGAQKVRISLGHRGSSHFGLSLQGEFSDVDLRRIVTAIKQTLTAANVTADVQIEPHRFRDYYSDPLEIEGPDGQRFGIDQVRASTPVSDLARGVMHQYADQGVWPTRAGQKTQAVIDKVDADGGSERLDPRQTLHDAGVRPGDTLRVSPERTAGAINPLLRDEALVRVRNEVLVYAENHPGFAVEANSLVAPTEYVFRFEARSFGPPISEGAMPTCVDRHEVYVQLLPDFPIKAPEAWWQTEIFHPNVDARSGKVCLGALDEHWRPAMDFGELCQMLVDMAAYRNYAVSEGYNEQAAKWAVSPAGQIAIERIGGISVIGRMVMDGTPEHRLRIRKLSP